MVVNTSYWIDLTYIPENKLIEPLDMKINISSTDIVGMDDKRRIRAEESRDIKLKGVNIDNNVYGLGYYRMLLDDSYKREFEEFLRDMPTHTGGTLGKDIITGEHENKKYIIENRNFKPLERVAIMQGMFKNPDMLPDGDMNSLGFNIVYLNSANFRQAVAKSDIFSTDSLYMADPDDYKTQIILNNTLFKLSDGEEYIIEGSNTKEQIIEALTHIKDFNIYDTSKKMYFIMINTPLQSKSISELYINTYREMRNMINVNYSKILEELEFLTTTDKFKNISFFENFNQFMIINKDLFSQDNMPYFNYMPQYMIKELNQLNVKSDKVGEEIINIFKNLININTYKYNFHILSSLLNEEDSIDLENIIKNPKRTISESVIQIEKEISVPAPSTRNVKVGASEMPKYDSSGIKKNLDEKRNDNNYVDMDF